MLPHMQSVDSGSLLGGAAPPADGAPLWVVALSGGVDSATCAALLVEAGQRVAAISMRLYNAKGSAQSSGGRCCGPRDLEDARQVCAHLGIPFYVANYEEDFRRAVIDDFVANYREGRTPNPCVRCNEKVKFLPLLYRARALGAQALCTGHYARISDGPDGQKRLLRAVDSGKDQSYFLFGMPRAALDYVRFPLGGLTKEEVRAHARRLGLPNADKAESQEICFVPDGDYAGFVQREVGAAQAGELIGADGQVLGHHQGVHRFTIGQRRGLGVGGGPVQYVTGIDAATGRVYIGPREALLCPATELTEVRWLIDAPPLGSELTTGVQIRYRRRPQPARVRVLAPDRVSVEFIEPELAVTPGQAAVFYDGETVLGGGFIAAPPEATGRARTRLPVLNDAGLSPQ